MRICAIVGHNTVAEPWVKHVIAKYNSGHFWITSTESATKIVDGQMQTLKVIAIEEKCLKKTVKRMLP